MIGICTDSSAQLPRELVERLGIEVVPLIVTIDGHDRLDGVDLDPDEFWSQYRDGHRPEVVMSEADPGQFAAAYEDLIAHGCTSIVSLHVAGSVVGALKAARLAAHSTPIPVRVVDTTAAGFAVGCAVWKAAVVAAEGASVDEVVAVAEAAAASLGHFLVLPAASGPSDGYTVIRVQDGAVEVMASHATAVEAINDVSARAVAWGPRLRVAIGHSDQDSAPIAQALEDGLESAASVAELVRFRIGPAMGALTGPGAVGCVMCPID
ncbi:MAG: DegV family protein [Ilumatobacteraceae bacterium]